MPLLIAPNGQPNPMLLWCHKVQQQQHGHGYPVGSEQQPESPHENVYPFTLSKIPWLSKGFLRAAPTISKEPKWEGPCQVAHLGRRQRIRWPILPQILPPHVPYPLPGPASLLSVLTFLLFPPTLKILNTIWQEVIPLAAPVWHLTGADA